MRKTFGRFAWILFLLGMFLERASLADPCMVRTPPDRLADDVGGSKSAGIRRGCIVGFGDYGMASYFAGKATTRLAASQLKLPPTVNHLPSSSGVLLRSRVVHESFDTTFQELKIGAGGFLRNLNIAASDGTMVTRADTMGGYYFNTPAVNSGNAGGTGAWVNVVTAKSMPTGDWAPGDAHGVEELAAYNSSTFYMNYNGLIFVTTNSGTTWIRGTGFTQDRLGSQQTYSNLLAIDPQNADFVFAGSAGNQMFVTTNGTSGVSSTWVGISTSNIPAGARMGVSFDPSSAVSGGKTQGVYAWSEGHGVYHSADAGSTWAQTPATNMPTTFKGMRADPFGNIWVYNDTSTLYKFDGTSWFTISPSGNGVSAFAYDPTNCASAGACHIFAVGGAGDLSISTNGGSTWVQTTSQTRVATDIPWLANVSSSSTGAVQMDSTGVMWYSEGVGIWKTIPPTTAAALTWTSVSTAIEQLVGNLTVAPPGGKPNVFSWDREQFYVSNPNVYPSAPGVNGKQSFTPIIGGWGADWASATPSTLIMLAQSNISTFDMSGYSSDGGRTWTIFGTPSTSGNSVGTGSKTWTVLAGLNINVGDRIEVFETSNYKNFMDGLVTSYSGTKLTLNIDNFTGSGTFKDWTVHTIPNIFGPSNTAGSMAASTTTNFMWVPSGFLGLGANVPWYTTDGGVHWTSLGSYFNTNFGIPTAGTTGWGDNYTDNAIRVAADRVNANTFYLYNSLASGSGGGIYMSTNGGATWAKQIAGAPGGLQTSSLAKLKAVPNNAGHLFMISNIAGDGLVYSKDSGVTWAAVQNSRVNFKNVNGFGFGAAFPGQSYPAIYLMGYSGSNTVDANYGLWRCTNFNPSTGIGTWTRLANFPINDFFFVQDIEGDKTTVGSVYGAFQGFGYFYGHLNFLLKRDLDPASNDNDPMWTKQAA